MAFHFISLWRCTVKQPSNLWYSQWNFLKYKLLSSTGIYPIKIHHMSTRFSHSIDSLLVLTEISELYTSRRRMFKLCCHTLLYSVKSKMHELSENFLLRTSFSVYLIVRFVSWHKVCCKTVEVLCIAKRLGLLFDSSLSLESSFDNGHVSPTRTLFHPFSSTTLLYKMLHYSSSASRRFHSSIIYWPNYRLFELSRLCIVKLYNYLRMKNWKTIWGFALVAWLHIFLDRLWESRWFEK